jgi:regulator of sigma E protease
MVILVKTTQLILSLSIMVALHEFGHFLAARIFKTRVEKFYLFFDFLFPFPGVLNFALFKKKIGDTEYGIGWFPLGGYVKIAGMIDESMDEEFLKSEPQPYEFRSKPAWQRLIIMLAGIIVNVLLAFTIYTGMLCYWGESYIPVENATYGFACDSTARKIGLEDGDKIISYNGGKKFNHIDRIGGELLLENAKTIEIERNGEKKSLNIPHDIYKEIFANRGADFLTPIIPCIADTVLPKLALANAGGKIGDTIVQLDSIPITYFHQFKRALPGFKNTATYIVVKRNTGIDTIKLTVPDSGIVGFAPFLGKQLQIVDKKYGFFQAIPEGVHRAFTSLTNYIKQFRLVFSSEYQGYKQVGGFLMIGQQFPSVWDWQQFWALTAFFSMALAFANLLPIPALDGGHALFTLIEMIMGRPLSDKFQERAQVVGMIILFGLLIWANGNDVMKLIFHK